METSPTRGAMPRRIAIGTRRRVCYHPARSLRRTHGALMRKLAVLVLLAVVLLAIAWFVDRDRVEQAFHEFTQEVLPVPASIDAAPRPEPTPPPIAVGDTIRVASFNIQVFGMSKLGKPDVMDVLAKVVRRFDVVAIQEIRSKDTALLPKFVQMINADGAQYDYVIGPRLGRTVSKEQYAYVYDTTRIEHDPQSVCTVEDPEDLLHREPFITRFMVRGPPAREAFTFSLVNIHTDPDETDTELNALDDVFVAAQQLGEDDVILLGDLNVDEHHLGELGQLPNIAWVVSGVTTNTRRKKAYDNIIFNRLATSEYTGQWGVFDLMAEFGLTMEQALKVSDHLPVWAEFSVYEAGVEPVVDNGGQTLPDSQGWMTDDVQYFPPGPGFILEQEAAAMREASREGTAAR